MAKHWVEAIFEQSGALLTGHFVLASGRHSDKYLEKTLVYTDPRRVFNLCLNTALDTIDLGIEVETVVGPAIGGVTLSSMTAYHLADIEQRKVLSFFTEKDEKGKQILKRGYQKLIAGKKVLIVDDILTTGGSIRQVIKEVEDAGGQVAAVAVICNRGGVTPEDIGGYPLFSLWNIDIESWTSEDCPLCRENIPLEDPKSR